MPCLHPCTLPRLSWGDPAARRRALLVHGLGSNARAHVAVRRRPRRRGWRADAVDLRGHGPRRARSTTRSTHTPPISPRSLPDDGELGPGARALARRCRGDRDGVADPSWTRRLVLIDPAIHLTRPRPRHRAREPGGVVRRPDHRGGARAPSAVARARHRAQGPVRAPGEPVGGGADESPERRVGCAGCGIRSDCPHPCHRVGSGGLLDLPRQAGRGGGRGQPAADDVGRRRRGALAAPRQAGSHDRRRSWRRSPAEISAPAVS